MASQQFSDFSADSQTYIAKKTLMRIKREIVVHGLAEPAKLPNRFSKTFQYTRYDKLNLPQNPLTEGVTPSAVSISLSTVQAVMDQWGSYVDISDVADLTVNHPVFQQAIELLGEQAAETVDRECIKVLLSNTSVYYPGAATSRVTLASTDYITSSLVKKVIAALRSGGAHPQSGRLFVGLIDPQVEMDLTEDSSFLNAASYSNIMALKNQEVGTWAGVRWVCSNLLPTMSRLTAIVSASSATAGSLTVATTYYFKVTKVSNSLGFEVSSTAEQSQATGGAQTSIDLTLPVDANHTYKVYFGAASGNTPLLASGIVGAGTYNVGTVGTGAQPPAHPAVGVVVHFSWIFGKESFAAPELSSLQTFVTPKGASDSDPLAQRRKASWKVMFKCVIQNESYISRIESASRY